MQGLIHFNPDRAHQCDHAQAFLSSGFAATPKADGNADVHVVSGPWFALNKWKHHPRVLMVDRAWWGDSDGYVSIGWLQDDGTRKFAAGSAARSKPKLNDWKPMVWETLKETRCLVLADYGQDVSDIVAQASQRFLTVNVREHPADRKRLINLQDDIAWHDVAIGTSGTAIFEAIQLGVPVICLDAKNEVVPVCSDSIQGELYRGDRAEWLHDMSYKQWSLAEIASGEAWEHLKDAQ